MLITADILITLQHVVGCGRPVHRASGKDLMRRPDEDQPVRKQEEPRAGLAPDHHGRQLSIQAALSVRLQSYEVALEQNLDE